MKFVPYEDIYDHRENLKNEFLQPMPDPIWYKIFDWLQWEMPRHIIRNEINK